MKRKNRKKNENKQDIRQELKQDILGYFSETTVHGFRYIVQGRNAFERIAWMLFIGFGFWYSGFTIYNAYNEMYPFYMKSDWENFGRYWMNMISGLLNFESQTVESDP